MPRPYKGLRLLLAAAPTFAYAFLSTSCGVEQHDLQRNRSESADTEKSGEPAPMMGANGIPTPTDIQVSVGSLPKIETMDKEKRGPEGGGGAMRIPPQSPAPAPAPNPNNMENATPGFSLLMDEATFNKLFPKKAAYYSYSDLKAAADADPLFAKEGSMDDRKREVAAFLANVGHETGDLVHVEEVNKQVYCKPSKEAPCEDGKKYYGRGPMQLSWNFNYANAGKALKLPLLEDPDLISRDVAVGWKVMFWYWNTQKGPGRYPSHKAIVEHASFGETIKAINGELECYGKEPKKVESRVRRYKNYSMLLGVDPGMLLDCPVY